MVLLLSQGYTIKEICSIVDGPVNAEVVSLNAAGMVREGKKLSRIHKNIVVKIPMTVEGLKATKQLSELKIKTNVTLIFSANQALLAATAGATFVSPFVGRLDDAGQDGLEVVRESVEIFDQYHLPAQILAASLRHPRHVIEAAQLGAQIATIPYGLLKAMVKHPLTDVGIERFLADSKAYEKESAKTPN